MRTLLDAQARECGRGVRLEIDGGVNAGNIAGMAAAGTDACVAGSAVFGAARADDPHRYEAAIGDLCRALRIRG